MRKVRLLCLWCTTFVVATGASADVPSDIAATQNAIDSLTAAIKPKVAPMLVSDSDIKVFISLQPVVTSANRIAALPSAQRSFAFHSTGRNGYFWKDDGDWCGSFAELQGEGDLSANGTLDALTASVEGDGSVVLRPTASLAGRVQAHLLFKGRRVRGPFGLGNFCPPGGGIGSSVGVGFSKGQPLAIKATFSQGGQSNVDYRIAIISPSSIDITLEIGFEHIGTLGVPESINVPSTPLASGSIPLLVQTSGKIELPNGRERAYDFALTPVQFNPTASGITASWKAFAKFH